MASKATPDTSAAASEIRERIKTLQSQMAEASRQAAFHRSEVERHECKFTALAGLCISYQELITRAGA